MLSKNSKSNSNLQDVKEMSDDSVSSKSSTGDDASTGTGSKESTTVNRREEEQIRKLTRKESRNVRIWRFVVFGMVLAVAIALTVFTYLVLSRSDAEAYKDSFSQYASTLIEAAEFRTKVYKEVFSAFGDTITAASDDSGFPLSTVEHFETHAGHVREQTGAMTVGFSPFVDGETRPKWDPYSVNNQRWIEQSWSVLGGSPAALKPISTTSYSLDDDGKSVVSTGEGPFVPVWMVSPPPVDGTIVNFDYLTNSVYKGLFGALTATEDTVISKMVDKSFLHVDPQDAENATDIEIPHGVILHPVYDTFDFHTRKLVGWLNAVFMWDNLFTGIVDRNAKGIYLTLENTCNQTITYLLSGADALYMGEGDLSDPTYHEERQSTAVLQFTEIDSGTGSDCLYTLLISPSDEFLQSYQTSDPVVFTIVIGCVFLAVIITFFVYDMYVQRRNDKITETAIRSNQVVTSLFPTELRERLFQSGQHQRNQADKLKTFLDHESMDEENVNADIMHEGRPVADLFPATTIMVRYIFMNRNMHCNAKYAFREFIIVSVSDPSLFFFLFGLCQCSTLSLPNPNPSSLISSASRLGARFGNLPRCSFCSKRYTRPTTTTRNAARYSKVRKPSESTKRAALSLLFY